MGRYLDMELNAGALSEENLDSIKERILKEYDIDLEKIARDGFQYTKLVKIIAQKCQLNGKLIDFRRLLFLEKDFKKFGESIRRLQMTQGTIVRANKKRGNKGSYWSPAYHQNSKDQRLSEKQVIKLYKKIKKRKKDKLKKMISLDDCTAIMSYILTNSILLEKDIILQYLMRYKYTQIATDKYFFSDERKNEKIDCRTRLKSIDSFPMKDSDSLPVFIKELQDILFTQKYIRMFEFTAFGSEKEREKEKGSLDITRYSYKYIEDLYSKMEGTSYENIYYLNDMLGISLTNTIFLCIYKMTKRYKKKNAEINYKILNEKIFDVAALLGKIKCIYCRDILAKVVFKYLLTFHNCKKQGTEDEEINRVYQSIGEACDQICDYLKINIDRINCYYSNLCDANAWLYANDNQLKLDFDNGAVSELEREWKIWMKKYFQSKAIDKVLGDYTRKSGNKYKIRKMKLIKEPDNLYAQIHMAVMKGIWE